MRIKLKLYLITTFYQESLAIFFANIVPSLCLQCKDDLLNSVQHIEYPLEKIIENFKQHPSIIAIMKYKPNKPIFSFSGVAKQSIESLIKSLDSFRNHSKRQYTN